MYMLCNAMYETHSYDTTRVFWYNNSNPNIDYTVLNLYCTIECSF